MYNRRVVKEIPNPFPWKRQKLYMVKAFRSWTVDAQRITVIDVSYFKSDRPRRRQITRIHIKRKDLTL